MSYTIKLFEELDIMDDFLMNVIANDEEVGERFCKTVLRVLLQREIGNIRIHVQRVMQGSLPTLRGIRLDVEIDEFDENEDFWKKNVYDLEVHHKDGMNLPKHNRFYQAKIDSQNMKSGEKNFVNLPGLFVITITDYDPFGHDYMMYTIRNRCEEIPELVYEDGLQFLYFNTKGRKGGNSSIKTLLNYIQDSKIDNVTDEATREIHDYVSRVKVLPEVRIGYMLLEEKLFYRELNGKIEGKVESVLELLEDLGEIPEDLLATVRAETDLEVLKKWHKLAAKAESIEDFIDKIKETKK